MNSKLFWFAAGVGSVYLFHKFVKAVPGKGQ
jgi:hypothetical protein